MQGDVFMKSGVLGNIVGNVYREREGEGDFGGFEGYVGAVG